MNTTAVTQREKLMRTSNEIGNQDLSHEPATPAPGTGHIGKAILTPHGETTLTSAGTSDPPSDDVPGTDADHSGALDGTTDAARPASTPAQGSPLPPPDRTAAGPAAGES